MAGAIHHISDLILVWGTLWSELVEVLAECLYHFDVLFFVVPTDIVGLSNFTLCGTEYQCSRMVFHIEPITNLVTFPIDG